MQIAICDDEKSMGQRLEEKVKKLLPDAVVETYLSGDDLISSGFKPHILFMDGGVIVEQGDPHEVIENPKEERTKQFLSRYAQG